MVQFDINKIRHQDTDISRTALEKRSPLTELRLDHLITNQVVVLPRD